MTTGHIRRRGRESWELKFDAGTDAGTGKRITRYASFRGSKKEAQVKLAELVTLHAKGAYVDRSRLTIARHVQARIEQWEAAGEITAKTSERYLELLNNQIAPHIGSKMVQKLTTANVEAWHGVLRMRGRKDGRGGLSRLTIRHAHRLLSQALKDGAKHNIVIRNVAADQGAPTVNEDEIEVQILTADRVREVITKLRGRAMYPKAITALFTGVRRGELLAAKWCNTELDGDQPVLKVREALEETKAHGVRFKKPKTKNGVRDISLPDIVVEALREHRKAQLEMRMALGLGRLPDDALIFPGADGGPQSPRAFSAYWADHAEQLGVGDITLHALRHTHASQLIDAGIDVVTISKRLGHANATVTLRIYAHQFRSRDDKSAGAINAALAGFGA
jgi:integrase